MATRVSTCLHECLQTYMGVYMPTRVSTRLHKCLQAYTSVYMTTRVSTCLHECPQALQIKVPQYVDDSMFPLKTVGKYETFFL